MMAFTKPHMHHCSAQKTHLWSHGGMLLSHGREDKQGWQCVGSLGRWLLRPTKLIGLGPGPCPYAAFVANPTILMLCR